MVLRPLETEMESEATAKDPSPTAGVWPDVQQQNPSAPEGKEALQAWSFEMEVGRKEERKLDSSLKQLSRGCRW